MNPTTPAAPTTPRSASAASVAPATATAAPAPSGVRSGRRPPAPSPSRGSSIATVTQLNRGGDRPTPVPVAAVQGTLALDLRTLAGMPATPELSLVASAGSGDEPVRDDVHGWAGRFAQAVVEVLGGDRPLPQLVRWTTKGVYHDLDRRVKILSRTVTPGQRRRAIRPQVRSVHVCRPTPRVAEVSVHVRHGQRSRALAARLELTAGRWCCTALQLG